MSSDGEAQRRHVGRELWLGGDDAPGLEFENVAGCHTRALDEFLRADVLPIARVAWSCSRPAASCTSAAGAPPGPLS